MSGTGTEIPRQITRLIEVTEQTVEVYDAIKDIRGLPEAFQEVRKWLPLVEQTLREAKLPAKKVKSTDDANMLETRLDNCETKADNLLEIFQKIARKSTEEFDPFVYRSIAVKLGKHRAETLMGGILEDLLAFVTHQMFQEAMQNRVGPLDKARQELANVSPSLSESDLDEQPGTAIQNGDGNRQFNNFGPGTQKNVDGNYFEAKGDQHLGTVPSKKSRGRKDT
ncbi:hypothetical protein N658DRAFT_500366 [Parathielavia hyrcaniae]|uniref:NACHT-NTPase and P-loop NTPases N-terminal domain-containing protein n=1 Tax=Parathielavia hyrcaniae TaxID=113614 RepID=A0AAN6PTH6_9PEZI|nr:hypothetical protein N658DRAFT_500366 [Parathielavia hyrcaniae]